MNDSIATPVKAKKTRISAGKTQVGRPGPAANEALPVTAWVLPMTAILRKLEDLAFAAGSVQDVDDGSDIFASRLGIITGVHFKNVSLAIEQGLRNSTTLLDRLFDGQALIRGAQAVDVNSPNREAINCLILRTIEAVAETENRDGFDDGALAQILAGLPDADKVPPIQHQPKPAEPQKVTLATSLLASGAAGRSLLLRASFDIETLGMNLVKQVVDLGLDSEESCMLRTMAVRICELNSPIMSFLSEDDMVSVGEVHARLNHGALGLPEGVVAA